MIITTGQPFTDIDSLACAIAYTQLKNLEGKDAKCVLPGPINISVINKIKVWNLDFSTTPSKDNDQCVLVDISDPEFFAKFVKLEDVIEVFDHRSGFEKYWSEKIGKNSHIEMVGACATLIWEAFVKSEFQNEITKTNANLLFTAIVSNTLNFQASVTTDRDRIASARLKDFSNLPNDWVKTYFSDRDEETEKDIENAVINDTKLGEFAIGQLELWDSKEIILPHLDLIEKTLENFGRKDWFLTSPSISEGRNFIFTKSQAMKDKLTNAIDVKFDGNIGTTKKLWLRKEIFGKI